MPPDAKFNSESENDTQNWIWVAEIGENWEKPGKLPKIENTCKKSQGKEISIRNISYQM